jgi:hypothetical protein
MHSILLEIMKDIVSYAQYPIRDDTDFRDVVPSEQCHIRVNDTDFWDVMPFEQDPNRVNDTDFRVVVPTEQYPVLKRVSLKLKNSSSISDKRINDCATVATVICHIHTQLWKTS